MHRHGGADMGYIGAVAAVVVGVAAQNDGSRPCLGKDMVHRSAVQISRPVREIPVEVVASRPTESDNLVLAGGGRRSYLESGIVQVRDVNLYLCGVLGVRAVAAYQVDFESVGVCQGRDEVIHQQGGGVLVYVALYRGTVLLVVLQPPFVCHPVLGRHVGIGPFDSRPRTDGDVRGYVDCLERKRLHLVGVVPCRAALQPRVVVIYKHVAHFILVCYGHVVARYRRRLGGGARRLPDEVVNRIDGGGLQPDGRV